jgi:hypothetical protein
VPINKETTTTGKQASDEYVHAIAAAVFNTPGFHCSSVDELWEEWRALGYQGDHLVSPDTWEVPFGPGSAIAGWVQGLPEGTHRKVEWFRQQAAIIADGVAEYQRKAVEAMREWAKLQRTEQQLKVQCLARAKSHRRETACAVV